MSKRTRQKRDVYIESARLTLIVIGIASAVLVSIAILGPVINHAVYRITSVRLFELTEWIDCIQTIMIVAFVTFYAPLLTCVLVYVHLSRRNHR